MRPLLPLLLLTSTALAAAPAAGQSHQAAALVKRPGFPPGTVAVVTSDGFFLPDKQSAVPHVFIPDSAFPGAPDFVRPAVQWEPGTSAFLVTGASHLFRVFIDSLEGGHFTIDDLTPATAAPMNLFDLDVNPGTGELFLLDQTTKTVERYQAPYAPGMVSDLSIPVPNTTRSIALDSRALPSSLLAGETNQVTRVFFDGSTAVVSFMQFPSGLDQDPQVAGVGGAYMCSGQDQIGRAVSNPGTIISMNFNDQCQPLALGTEDLEWEPVKGRAYVLAENGTNQVSCPGFSSGPNQVVRFPAAQIPGLVQPKLYTNASGSGITGTEGDLAIAYQDFAFVTPYGAACNQGAPGTMALDVAEIPVAGLTSLTVKLAGAPANSPATLVAGFQRTATPLASGCILLASPDLLVPIGTTDAQGAAQFIFTLPPGIQSGTDLYLQGAITTGGAWSVSQGLMVHFGL